LYMCELGMEYFNWNQFLNVPLLLFLPLNRGDTLR
jgi:hypothetical protein